MQTARVQVPTGLLLKIVRDVVLWHPLTAYV
ncbi:MAG: hypothetical protein ACD_75C01770G0002 [uncultured bacterium]|nr:MAG: hypothetical protein ACD_75C01770G0002 [uncultured bacterium]